MEQMSSSCPSRVIEGQPLHCPGDSIKGNLLLRVNSRPSRQRARWGNGMVSSPKVKEGLCEGGSEVSRGRKKETKML